MIWSPGWRPSFAAGRPSITEATVRVASPPLIANSAPKSTTAKRRFIPGPAKMTKTRFQTGARQ